MIITELEKNRTSLEERTLFALKAGLDLSGGKVRAYVLVYPNTSNDIVMLKKTKSPEELANYIKNNHESNPVELSRKPQIQKFYNTKKGTIYMFAEMNKNEKERFNL